MLNLLGDLWRDDQRPTGPRVLALPGTHLHLYGKAQARPGRKMGHLTVTASDARGGAMRWRATPRSASASRRGDSRSE